MTSKSANYVTIDGRNIGASYAPYIVAEMYGNHNHDLNRGIKDC